MFKRKIIVQKNIIYSDKVSKPVTSISFGDIHGHMNADFKALQTVVDFIHQLEKVGDILVSILGDSYDQSGNIDPEGAEKTNTILKQLSDYYPVFIEGNHDQGIYNEQHTYMIGTNKVDLTKSLDFAYHLDNNKPYKVNGEVAVSGFNMDLNFYENENENYELLIPKIMNIINNSDDNLFQILNLHSIKGILVELKKELIFNKATKEFDFYGNPNILTKLIEFFQLIQSAHQHAGALLNFMLNFTQNCDLNGVPCFGPVNVNDTKITIQGAVNTIHGKKHLDIMNQLYPINLGYTLILPKTRKNK